MHTSSFDLDHNHTTNCITTCIQGIVNTRSSNIFAQASFSAPVFEVARSVIALFEEGKLKGQKETRELTT